MTALNNYGVPPALCRDFDAMSMHELWVLKDEAKRELGELHAYVGAIEAAWQARVDANTERLMGALESALDRGAIEPSGAGKTWRPGFHSGYGDAGMP